MQTPLIITLIVLIALIYALVTKIVPFGVSSMLACVILVILGVVDQKTAFSGLSTNTTIIVATMLVVAQALGKTSLISRLKRMLENLQGKSTFAVIIPLVLITILLSQLMGQIACLSIMLIFLQSFDEDSELNPGRVFFFLAVINTIWLSKLPIGMGATMPFLINSFYEGMIQDKSQLLILTDFFKGGILPSIVVTLYSLIVFKWIPKTKIQIEKNKDAEKVQEVDEKNQKRNEIIIFIIFALVMIGFMFQDQIGKDITNTIPALGVIVLILLNVMNIKEVVGIMTSDMVWMVIGMQGMSAILGKTGLGEVIGQNILKLLGNNPSPLMITAAFVIVTSILTNFVSNLGTMAMMTPIAVSAGLAAGMDPRPLALAVGISCWFAFVLPTGSAGAAMGFAIGNHNPVKIARYAVPALILLDIALIINLKLMFGF